MSSDLPSCEDSGTSEPKQEQNLTIKTEPLDILLMETHVKTEPEEVEETEEELQRGNITIHGQNQSSYQVVNTQSM